MSDKKDSDDTQGGPRGPKPETGEGAPGTPDSLAGQGPARDEPHDETREDVETRPEESPAHDSDATADDDAPADAETEGYAEAEREAEMAAGLEERGSDDADRRDAEEEPEPAADLAPESPRPEPEPEPEPEPIPYAADYPHSDDQEEPQGTSLAARALQGLVLLLIGAAVALWGAPKVAPHVPAPVARYLAAPTAVEPADLESLRADLETRLAERADALSARIDAAAEGPDLDAALDAGLAPLRARLDELAAQVEAAGGGASPERVASLENAVSDLRARTEALQASLSGLGEAAGAEASPELAERVAGFNAVVESLRAEIASVSSRTGDLAARLDAAEARFEEEIDAARAETEAAQTEAQAAARRAQLAAGFRTLDAALEEGRPYADALAAMSAHADPPEALTASAETGVPTLAALRADFTAAGRRAMRARNLAEAGDGALDQALAAIRGSLAGVPVEEVEGEGLEAALGRAAARLRAGELAAALDALDGVSEPAAEAMSGWLADARARHRAVQAARDWRDALLGGA